MKIKSKNTIVLILILSLLSTVLFFSAVKPFKILVILILALVFSALISALYHLVSKKGDSTSLLISLSWRIGISAFLFIFLLIASQMGWVKNDSTLLKIESEAAKSKTTTTQKK